MHQGSVGAGAGDDEGHAQAGALEDGWDIDGDRMTGWRIRTPGVLGREACRTGQKSRQGMGAVDLDGGAVGPNHDPPDAGVEIRRRFGRRQARPARGEYRAWQTKVMTHWHVMVSTVGGSVCTR